ncbi:IS3 family transposase [Miltoncostaea marina]|uniref:IS3 family transposase n=1 Tax=Miltoncostaea marina TaxID=2843215 RepID=UPI001C3D4483
MSRFRFVADHRAAHCVKRLCRTAGCSRAGCYDRARRPHSAHARRHHELSALIDQVHERSRRTYGAPRIHAELRRLGAPPRYCWASAGTTAPDARR